MHFSGEKIPCSLEHRERAICLERICKPMIEIIDIRLNALSCMIDQKLLVVSHFSTYM